MNNRVSLDNISVGENAAQTELKLNKIKRETPGRTIDLDARAGLGGVEPVEVSVLCSVLGGKKRLCKLSDH